MMYFCLVGLFFTLTCNISSGSSLFVKGPIKGFPVQKGPKRFHSSFNLMESAYNYSLHNCIETYEVNINNFGTNYQTLFSIFF